MKVRIVCLILLFFLSVFSIGPGLSTELAGKNIHWAPGEDLFFYSAVGKSSGSLIWRLYDPQKEEDLDTLFFGKDILPSWSHDGSSIAYQKGNILVLWNRHGAEESIETQVEEIDYIIWSPDRPAILYTGDNRIFLHDLDSGNSSFIAYGQKPVFLPDEKGLYYTDDNFILYFMNARGEKDIVLEGVDDYVVSADGSVMAAYQGELERFCIMDLNSGWTNFLPSGGYCAGFDLDREGKYLVFSQNGSSVHLIHLMAGRSVRLIEEGMVPHFSYDRSRLSYELRKSQARIVQFDDLLESVPGFLFYRIGAGQTAGLQEGQEFSVFEEKVNPFSGEVTGFDPSRPKGKIRLISVYEDFSIAEISGEIPGGLELNDAVRLSDGISFAPILAVER